jgi:hypothetical protein
MRKRPREIKEIPKILNQLLGNWGIFSITDFILSGKVK